MEGGVPGIPEMMSLLLMGSFGGSWESCDGGVSIGVVHCSSDWLMFESRGEEEEAKRSGDMFSICLSSATENGRCMEKVAALSA